MSALPKRYFTPEEYILLECASEYKSQYVAGEIYAMSGMQPWHIDVAVNLVTGLHSRFRGRPCKVYFSGMRVRVKAGDLWTYPDVAALCGKPKYDKSHRPWSLLNPQVIFEILSPSTEEFDRGDKFTRYQKLDSLTDYVLVSAAQMQIEHHTRQADGNWVFRQYDQPSDLLSLASVDASLPLAKIYERVGFPEADEANADE